MTSPPLNNFITQIIDEDLSSGRHKTITTRFPPEPNGYLHLGHAKSICLNFGLARQYGGDCHLRFDDTNPETEENVYIESIKRDVEWLGGDWGEKLYHTSDYFDQLYEWAVILIKKGLAYVDDQTEEEVRLNRGSLFELGKDSFYRDRSVEENLSLFEKMKNGDLHEGSCILRAKIDMTHSNMNMRDPPMYRIKKKAHPRTGDKWVIYPIYDWAHGQSDSIERISHSICTLEFSLHKMLYDWFQEKLNIYPTRQIEFARLNLTFTVLSKRRLIKLVNSNYVNGWDDPRMPTISGCRRRGYPASAIRNFVHEIGVAKRDIVIPFSKLESFVRDELEHVQRRIVVIDPVKVRISGLPTEGICCFALNHPKDTEAGTRPIQLTPEIFIQKTDFMISPIAKFNRLSPGKSVNLKYANIAVKCDQLVEENGNLELICSVCAPSSKNTTIHWLGTNDYVEGEVRLYDTLFLTADPDEGKPEKNWEDNLNPKSLIVQNALYEKSLADISYQVDTIPADTYQFERVGFFIKDSDTSENKPVFNLTVKLTDSFSTEVDMKEKLAKEEDKLARIKAAEERKIRDQARAERKQVKKAADEQPAAV